MKKRLLLDSGLGSVNGSLNGAVNLGGGGVNLSCSAVNYGLGGGVNGGYGGVNLGFGAGTTASCESAERYDYENLFHSFGFWKSFEIFPLYTGRG